MRSGDGDEVDTFPSGQALPRAFDAEGITRAHRAIYLDVATLPRWLVRSLARNAATPLNGYSWRIDLPATEPLHTDFHPGIDSAYAFLLRGSLTSASRALAGTVGLFTEPAPDGIATIREGLAAYLLAGTPLAISDRVFDSVEERNFYRALVHEISNGGLAVSVVPQVGFQTLAPSSGLADAGFRVDFALSTSSGKHVVIEVDGAQHSEERVNDTRRDAALASAGFRVIRIAASAVRADPAREARRALLSIGVSKWDATDERIRILQQLSQLQIAVLAAMRAGLIASVGRVAIDVRCAVDTNAAPSEAFDVALSDLSDLLRDTALARGSDCPTLELVREDSTGATRIVFGSRIDDIDPAAIYIHDCIQIAPPLIELGAADAPSGGPIDRGATLRLFERCYGFEDFLDGQFETIERVIRGLDTLLLLPTGAGKSATYQFAALIRGGVCVVVDPLLSLINDQIQNLREHGVNRSAQVTSQNDAQQREALVKLLIHGQVSFVFVSPERLQRTLFRKAIQLVALRRDIALITIDEAHCVSQWGHDFRPAYLNVAQTIRGLSRNSADVVPPLLAMTGTASHAVLRDIQRALAITDPSALITPKNFDRKELRFEVIPCASRDKGFELQKVLVGLPKRFRVRDEPLFWSRRRESPITGLVFCPHVNGGHGTVEVAEHIRKVLPRVAVATYSGQAPNGATPSTWPQEKLAIATQFSRNEIQVLACTNSFGMGIDKQNIRFTIHWGLPQSIESFYQEAGRAGRDRAESWCFLLASDDNPKTSARQLASQGPLDKPPWDSASDIDRQLWFHKQSFPDKQEELARLEGLVDMVMTAPERVVEIGFGADKSERSIIERAVYRLLLIGVASDYTVDERKGVFQVHSDDRDGNTVIDRFTTYVKAFNAKLGIRHKAEIEKWRTENNATAIELARHASELLVAFTYEQIEGTRRRALLEMRNAAMNCAGNEDVFRDALLRYLSTSSKFSPMLQRVAEDLNGGFELIAKILDCIEAPLDAADLASQSARHLSSIFNHPGLLVIHAAALLASPNPNAAGAAQDIALAFESASKFDLEPTAIVSAVDAAFDALDVHNDLRGEFAGGITRQEENKDRARNHAMLLAHSHSPVVAERGLSYLMIGIHADTDRLLETLKYVV